MFYTVKKTSILLSVRLTPKASKNSVAGTYQDANGSRFLKITVTAPAEDNKANTALITFLANKLKIAKSNFSIIQGHTHRNKIVQIDTSTPDILLAQICQIANKESG